VAESKNLRLFLPLPVPSHDEECKLLSLNYAVIFEKTSTGWSAYAPHLPGLGVTSPTYEVTHRWIHEGIAFHIEGIHVDAGVLPEATTA